MPIRNWFKRSNAAQAAGPAHVPVGDLSQVSDEEFLRRFVIDRDDRAFAELVSRHGGMVMGVSRRMLGNPQDAEDAFQAVFLVLARKANSLRSAGSLPAWLHKTAFRIALRARALRAKRREQPSEELDMIAADSLSDIGADYDQSIVDEELNALPERYRLPLFLCCVEGKPLDAAARQLGWSVGSLKGRLERGRAELRRRLLLRRVPYALAIAFLAVGGAASAKAATGFAVGAASTSFTGGAVSSSLIASTAQAAVQCAAGRSALGYVSSNALTLAHGSLPIMSITAAKLVVGSVLITGLLLGTGIRVPSPASADGGGSGRIVLESGFTPAPTFDGAVLALADEPRREGDKPREGETRRESAEREGDRPAGAREGEARREGERPATREGEARRDGERPATGEGGRPTRNPLADFRPQTPREQALVQMIMQLQREVEELRKAVATRGGADGRPAARDGERPAGREGDGERKAGPRDGEAPKAGAREGDAPRRDGERSPEVPKKDGDR